MIVLNEGKLRVVHVVAENLRANLKSGKNTLPMIAVRNPDPPNEIILLCHSLSSPTYAGSLEGFSILESTSAIAGTHGRGICVLRTARALLCHGVTQYNPDADRGVESAAVPGGPTRRSASVGDNVMSLRRSGTAPAARDEYGLSFQDILTRREKGIYEHRNGKLLIVYSRSPALVQDPNVRTRLTRTGMCIVDRNGGVRKLIADRNQDTTRNWKVYDGDPVCLEGNPHRSGTDPQEDGDDVAMRGDAD